MVLSCSQEPVWTGKASYITPEAVSEYVLAASPRKIEMAASSVYGTLPRAPKYHRRQMSEAAVPVKYMTDPGKQSVTKERKKSFFAGLANKFRYAVDGKPKLHWSTSEEIGGSTGSLYREDFTIPENRASTLTQRSWTKGFEHLYSSQRKSASRRKTTLTKGLSKDNVFAVMPSSESSTPTSSVPSSPESRRSSFSSKRARRTGYSGSVKARDYTSNRDSFGSISPEDTSKKSTGTKLLIVGGEGVGKSALTVRFLTKRYIGEYAPEIESVYDQTINMEGKDVNVHIWDSAIPDIHQTSEFDTATDSNTLSHAPSLMSVTSSAESCRLSNRLSNSSLEDESNHKFNPDGMSRKNRLRHTINKTIRRFRSAEGSDTDDDTITSSNHLLTEAERRLKWADGVVVVYSICDQSSFDAARDVIRYIRRAESSRHGSTDLNCKMPILLLGNKVDLVHRRTVKTSDAKELSTSLDCDFTEISVSEGYEPVFDAMKDHIKVIRKFAKCRDGLKHKFRKSK